MMISNTNNDPYKAHCLRCNYTWTKHGTEDPKVCPHCNSRVWKKPKSVKGVRAKAVTTAPESKLNSMFQADSLFSHGEAVATCPICSEKHFKVLDVLKYDNSDIVIIEFQCEKGHRADLHLNFVDGYTVCELVEVKN